MQTQGATFTMFHHHNTLIPAFDDLSDSKCKFDWLSACSTTIKYIAIFEFARVVNGDLTLNFSPFILLL